MKMEVINVTIINAFAAECFTCFIKADDNFTMRRL